MDDMYRTPSRKMSLRRKRCGKPEEISESPLHKKTSPSSSTRSTTRTGANSSEKNTNEERLSQVYYTRRSSAIKISTSLVVPTTPKNFKSTRIRTRSSSTKNNNDVRSFEMEEVRRNQHSPDTPFISSQLCGTQECEVVWDCNSPGFSKDDLKRISGKDENEESSSPVVFVAPVLHRTLFPKSRMRNSNNNSAVNTTAQLDELLSKLSAKGYPSQGNEEDSPALASNFHGASTSSSVVQDLIPPYSPPHMDEGSVSPSPPIPILSKNPSSQPFMVCKGKKIEDIDCVTQSRISENAVDSEVFEDSAWGEDLNAAICDISDENEIFETQNDTLGEKKVIAGEKGEGSMSSNQVIKVEQTSKSRDSMDIFDDDYFNDTVILSTQLWEKEVLEKETKTSKSVIDVEKVLIKTPEFDRKELQKLNENSISACILSKQWGESAKVQQPFDNKPPISNFGKGLKGTSSESAKPNNVQDDTMTNPGIRGSPIIGKSRVSPDDRPSQRRVRNTFRLDFISNANAVPEQKSTSSVPSLSNVNTNKNCKIGVDTTNLFKDIVSYRSKDCVIENSQDQMENSGILKRMTEPFKCKPRKSLFTSDSKDNIVTTQENNKISFPRSQSTGNVNASNSKSSILSRPIKSEDAEGSREFEEDNKFFESIMCSLPEDDVMLSCLKEERQCPASDSGKTQIHKENIMTSSFPFKANSKKNQISTCNMSSTNHLGNLSGQIPVNGTLIPIGNSFSHGMSALKLKSGEGGVDSLKTNIQTKTADSSNTVAKKDPSEDILDDDIFEDDDVLSLIDEVESQFGSQPAFSQTSQLSQSPKNKCTSDEIARKKEEAIRRREEKQRLEDIAIKKTKALRKREEKHKIGINLISPVETEPQRDAKMTEVELRNVEELQRQEKQKIKDVARKKMEIEQQKIGKQKREDLPWENEEEKYMKNEKLMLGEIAKKKEKAEKLRREKFMSQEIIRLEEAEWQGKEKLEAEELVKIKQEEQWRREKLLNEEVAKKTEEAKHLRREKLLVEETAWKRDTEQLRREKVMEEISKKKEEAERRRREKLKLEEQKQKEIMDKMLEKEKLEEIARKKEAALLLREQKQKMEEIARKKEEAQRRREERLKSRQQNFP